MRADTQALAVTFALTTAGGVPDDVLLTDPFHDAQKLILVVVLELRVVRPAPLGHPLLHLRVALPTREADLP